MKFKELKRNTLLINGVYEITCEVNGKRYIGSSIDVHKRIKQHYRKLKLNIHENLHLQRSYNKYGEDNFTYRILEECNLEEILEIENKYIKMYDTICGKKGFNCLPAKRNDELRCNLDYLKKLSKAKKGKLPVNYNLFRERCARPILEYENGKFVKEYSSCKEAGKVLQICHKLINNVLSGKVKKIRVFPNKTWVYKDGNTVRNVKKVKKPRPSRKVIQCTYDNIIIAKFDSVYDAANKLQIPTNTIRNSCNNRTKRCISLKCLFHYE